MQDQQTTAEQEHRVRVVAGIRALADLIESDTTLPVPEAISAQHSLFSGLTDEGRRLIRDVAADLGIDANAPAWRSSYLREDADSAAVEYRVAGPATGETYFRVAYVLHGVVKRGEQS